MKNKVVYLLKLWILRKKQLQNPQKKSEKKDILNNLSVLFEVRKRVLDVFESKIFQEKLKLQVETRSRTIVIPKYLLLNKCCKDYQ